jgi:magnesium chelatase family protein
LPPVSGAEALEITKIWSIAGALAPGGGVVENRPFRAPHHSISRIALAGGGSIPAPGEISLAHHGVLFLDELPEFPRATIEILRQPLELGSVTIARAHSTCTYPARFALIAAMNPCPCGFRGTRSNDCRCDDSVVARYMGKLSGPILDRIDLHVEVRRLPFDDMYAGAQAETSAAIRERVTRARGRQSNRYGGGIAINATLPAALARQHCEPDSEGVDLMRTAAERGMLSARALDRITRVARTIADLAGAQRIAAEHIAEAIGYRILERRGLAA